MGEVEYRYFPGRQGRRRPVGENFVVPSWFVVEVDDPGLDFLVELDVVNAESGPFVYALVLLPREGQTARITTEALRGVRVAEYLRESSAANLHTVRRPIRNAQGEVVGAVPQPTGKEYLQERERQQRTANRRIPLDDLRRVADSYRAAIARGEPPTAAVQRDLNLKSRAQAARWVAKARDGDARDGFLGPAPGRRRAGEVTQPTAKARAATSGVADAMPPTRSSVPRVAPASSSGYGPTAPKPASKPPRTKKGEL